MKLYSGFKRWVEQKKIQKRLDIFAVIWIILITSLLIGKNIHYSKELGTFVRNGFIPSPTPDYKKEIIVLTNNERVRVGLNALTENNLLNKAVEEKAKDLIDKDYWAHFPPNENEEYTWKFIRESGYNYLYSGENLGKGFFDSNSQVSAWMGSEEHKENILGENFTEIGVAAIKGHFQTEDTIVMVQEFGSPQSNGYQTSANQNQYLNIDQVKKYRSDTVSVKNNWISAKNRFPADKIDTLIDSFNRQIAFSDQIINDYEKNGKFSDDNYSLWQAIAKMGNESSQLTSSLNSL